MIGQSCRGEKVSWVWTSLRSLFVTQLFMALALFHVNDTTNSFRERLSEMRTVIAQISILTKHLENYFFLTLHSLHKKTMAHTAQSNSDAGCVQKTHWKVETGTKVSPFLMSKFYTFKWLCRVQKKWTSVWWDVFQQETKIGILVTQRGVCHMIQHAVVSKRLSTNSLMKTTNKLTDLSLCILNEDPQHMNCLTCILIILNQ